MALKLSLCSFWSSWFPVKRSTLNTSRKVTCPPSFSWAATAAALVGSLCIDGRTKVSLLSTVHLFGTPFLFENTNMFSSASNLRCLWFECGIFKQGAFVSIFQRLKEHFVLWYINVTFRVGCVYDKPGIVWLFQRFITCHIPISGTLDANHDTKNLIMSSSIFKRSSFTIEFSSLPMGCLTWALNSIHLLSAGWILKERIKTFLCL